MKKINLKLSVSALVLAFVAAGSTQASAQTVPLLPGGLVVSLYGQTGTPETVGNTYLDGNATPISLEEFSTAEIAGIDNAAPLLKESLPDAGTGANVGIVGEYGSSSEGTIQLSGNDQYVTIAGYDGNEDENGAPNGAYSNANGTAEAQSTDTNVPRVAAVIDISTGAVNTSTVLNDIYNGNNPRSVYTSNGTNLYFSGQGFSKTDQGGIYATTTGTNTTAGGSAPTAINTTSSTRTVTQANVNASTGSNSPTAYTYYSMDQNSRGVATSGIFEYSGSPTSSQGSNMGTRITAASLTSNGSTVYMSPEGFFFANATTLYVADTGSPKITSGGSDGGIQKWSYDGPGNTWTLDYTLKYAFPNTSSETGFESLTGQVLNNGTVDLYATSYTTNDDDPDGLYGVVDTLSNTTAAQESVLLLASSQPDNDFKGVAIIPQAVPEPSSVALLFGSLGGLLLIARRKFMAEA